MHDPTKPQDAGGEDGGGNAGGGGLLIARDLSHIIEVASFFECLHSTVELHQSQGRKASRPS